ncbi:hypothetical protein CCY98_08025 [Helicobacter sp. 11-8110]|nr:hypothetical protein CCY98_08025 [Helicobacter sp. 11-8110]
MHIIKYHPFLNHHFIFHFLKIFKLFLVIKKHKYKEQILNKPTLKTLAQILNIKKLTKTTKQPISIP